MLTALVVCTAAAIGLLHGPCIPTQERSVPAISFEVASVKSLGQDVPVDAATSPRRSGGRVVWKTTRSQLVRYAFRLESWQISGLERDDGFYEIDATANVDTTDDQLRLMMQQLLIDRFKLAYHREMKERSGYSLVVAKNGLKIKPADDGANAAPLPEWLAAKGEGTSKAIEGTVFTSREGKGVTAVSGRRATIGALAETLQAFVQTFVVDRTGLTGKYYFAFKCLKADAPADADAATVFTALQDALGLRLEKQTSSVEVLVIEHVEKTPTEN